MLISLITIDGYLPLCMLCWRLYFFHWILVPTRCRTVGGSPSLCCRLLICKMRVCSKVFLALISCCNCIYSHCGTVGNPHRSALAF